MATEIEKKELLEGNFRADHRPSSRAIRVYISSEYTDTVYERSHVMKDVYPCLRSHCASLGLQFYGVDMFNSLPSSLGLTHTQRRASSAGARLGKEVSSSSSIGSDKDHAALQEDRTLYQLERMGVFKLVPREIELCQSLSAGPNFVTLLSHKYGYKPLHCHIQQEDFDLLYAVIEEQSDRELMQQWYLLDTNAQPPEYVQQPWNPEQIGLRQWMNIRDSLSKTIRKAAKVALGKDVSKVQKYVMSAVEEEITRGIFNLRKQNPNQCCFWFKRVFTDLLDQRPSDPSLGTYADMTLGKRGLEFDSESLKILNHLKEARLPAKYIGLDSANIFEYPIKWQKAKGLDPIENSSHEEYLQELSKEMTAAFKAKISDIAEHLDHVARDRTYQEALHHATYCKMKANTFMDRPSITDKLYDYLSSSSSVPLVVYGKAGSGKTHIMAGTAYSMRGRFPHKNSILIARFIGTSPQSLSIRNTLRSLCKQLSVVLKEDPHLIPGDFPSITAHFKTLLCKATAERSVCILLDGVDQLSPEDGASGLSWLPLKIPPHVKIILSTSNDKKYRCYPVLQSLLAEHPKNLIEVPLLTREECRVLLAHKLSLKGRTLTSDQETAAMMVLQRCPTPLYLDLVLVQAQQWKSYYESNPWESAAPPTTLKGMTQDVFSSLETEFGEVFFRYLASCLSATKYGLTEMELLDMLSCNPQVMEEVGKTWENRAGEEPLHAIPSMLWSQVHHTLQPLVELNMGSGDCHVIRWSHRYFSECAVSRYLNSEDKARQIHGDLADYFSGKFAITHEEEGSSSAGNDSTMPPLLSQPLFLDVEKGRYNVRKLTELPFCLAKSGRKQELQNLLTDYSWLKAKIHTSSCSDVVEEFSAVLPVVPLQRSQSDMELSFVRDTLSLSIKALNSDPLQLPAQLYGRLMPSVMEAKVKRPILERLLTAALEDCQSLLTPAQPLQLLPGGPLLLTMKGHRDAISALAMTSLHSEGRGKTGLCLISASWDKTLKTWDLTTTGVLKTFDGHTDKVLSVTLTMDGQYAASGSADMTVRLWHVPSAECLHVIHGHTAAVHAVVMMTNGTKTISGSSDGSVKVWNTDITSSYCGEIIFTMKNSRSPVLSMALFSDQFLASGSKDSVALVCDVVSGSVLHTHRGTDGPITAISIITLKSDTYLLIGSESGCVRVRELESGKLVQSLLLSDTSSGNNSNSNCGNNMGNISSSHGSSGGSSSGVTSISASSNGRVVTSYDNRVLAVWDLPSGGHLYNFTGHQDSVLSAVMAGGCDLVLTGCRDSSLHIWDLLRPPLQQDHQHGDAPTSVSISPCGIYGISGGGDSKLKLYDLESTSVVGEIETGRGGVTQVLVLRDSEHVVVAHCDGSLQLWNGVSKEPLLRFSGHEAAVNCIAVSSDSSLLMSGSEDSQVAFWSMKSGTKLRSFQNHSSAVVGVAFAYDRMVSASRDGKVCIREFQTAKILHTSVTHTSALLCLAVSPNSAIFVTGARDKACHVVDMETGKIRCMLRGHGGHVTCVRVLANCVQCLTGCEDGCIRVWDVEGGDCLTTLCTDAALTSCDISWKASHILYGTEGGRVSTAIYNSSKKGVVPEYQGCEPVSSDSSLTGSGSTVRDSQDAVGDSQDAVKASQDAEGDSQDAVEDSQDTSQDDKTRSDVDKEIYVTLQVDAQLHSSEGPPIVMAIPNKQLLPEVGSTQYKQNGHINGFDPIGEIQRQEPVTHEKMLLASKETSPGKTGSSACLIL